MADDKISQLDEVTSLTSTAVFPVSTGAVLDTKKITMLNFLGAGWLEDSNTWTYASATTFTISGNVTTQFPVGTKLKLTNSTVKYFYVVSAAYSAPNTTVTVTGGSDYALASAAITTPCYSYASTPQSFPQWMNWTPTLNGGNSDLSGYDFAKFCVTGRVCHVKFVASNKTVSGTAGNIRISLPIAVSATSTAYIHTFYAVIFTGGAYLAVRNDTTTSGAYVDLFKNFTSASFDGNETGLYVHFTGNYEV